MEQVIVVGDLNIAAGPNDVHPTFDYERIYTADERGALHALMGDLSDVWRLQHPEEASVFTVWEERTSARAFNEGVASP
ncbi:hypothetical protein WJX84_007343 [Apatococcus fuscideae]|uniref:Uncharacterized protein n=1 Tax=Apatococcus fuscideae TaxID=2026836 RepID=A0AAW1SU95_9CHLO